MPVRWNEMEPRSITTCTGTGTRCSCSHRGHALDRTPVAGTSGRAGGQMPWIDPTAELSDQFQVVAMDQRNAGRSSAPIRAADSWSTYTADHLALMDHLGFERVHVMGGCIGSSYCLGLCQAAPERVTAAVLQNPIGLSADNRDSFFGMFDGWAKQLQADRDDVEAEALASFRQSMFGGEFVFSVGRDFVRPRPRRSWCCPGTTSSIPGPWRRRSPSWLPKPTWSWSGPVRSITTKLSAACGTSSGVIHPVRS